MLNNLSKERIALIGFGLAVFSAIGLLIAAFGYRLELWIHKPAFVIIQWMAYAGGLAALVSLVGAVMTRENMGERSFQLAVIGLIAGALVVYLPYNYKAQKKGNPRLSDITTDTVSPPNFVAAAEARKSDKRSKLSTKYGGAKFAKLQKKGYPDIKTVTFATSPDKVFDVALDLVKDRGWEMHASNKKEGHIEAMPTTFWFGFRDDMVIRVKGDGNSAKFDMRSASRCCKNDWGTNARRIRSFVDDLKKRIK
ncbi:MAG: DUF1499 domain-containing protein [Proteobacteria bacterium]|nr:DUF1499 domain-containing protein [Pseudomonadota bacterium]